MERVVLDTGVLIAGTEHDLSELGLGEAADIAIPAVAVAEFELGCLLDNDRERAEANREYLQGVLEAAPVLDYSLAVAEEHARLMQHTRQEGRPRGSHDLIIAAIAKTNGRAVATTDQRAAFGDLPGVDCLLINPRP
ncbi:type II toxin-antitoxin system VapC family toxin [Sciscionella sediminilitoris]|uniref:type II toxin-antitoxin system VapC family toxin n=1 Tax=Sciscionella sediminilitoris TaxID=1445613 RepID=UPI0004DF8CA3|nr:type II toxin-antitoxin system VapC family toxin [Sciscionella sp. SE31]